MSPPTYKTLDALIAAGEELVGQVDTISLDVFDTLFVRSIEDPDLIKIPVARYVASEANRLGIEISWLEVAKLRNSIERDQRARNGKEYPDHEACYDDFMPAMLTQVFGEKAPDDLFSRVADYEIKLENGVIAPRARLVEWVDSLSKRGKRLFLMSDIYLPAKYIERMLVHNGLDHYFEGVISSADSFNAKASGTGYQLVQERYGLALDKWLHVGDNPISDGVRPLELGIRALVIDDPIEKHRKALAKTYYDYSTRTNFWKGRNLQQLMLPLESENTEHEELYVQGYNLLGIFFGYFMHRLAERCRELELKRVYFCSREGWLLQQCWDRFAGWYFREDERPEARYLYVSRIALARAMIGNVGMSTREVEVALLPRENDCFADVCRIFGLDAGAFEPYLAEYNLSMTENIGHLEKDSNAESRRKLGRILMDSKFQALARHSGQRSRDALVCYLNSEGFFDHEDIGVVDIGWLGTIHNNLFNAVSHLDKAPRIHGFLMAATRHIDYPNTRDRYFEGLLYDRHKFEIAGSLIQYTKDNLEELCRAPHPSLLAYEPDENEAGFKLLFRSEHDESAIAERAQSDYYAPLQRGVLDSVESYATGQAVLGYATSEVKPWIDFCLYKHLAFPRTRDVVRMRLKSHQDDFAKRDTAKTKTKHTDKGLWQRSAASLRFVPGLRSRELKKHCYRMLKL